MPVIKNPSSFKDLPDFVSELNALFKSLIDKYPQLSLLLAVSSNGENLIMYSNHCVVCFNELIEDYIQTEDIPHTDDLEQQDVKIIH